MFQEINDRIATLKTKQRQKANWEQQQKSLSVEIQEKSRERDRWAKRLEQEQKDVDRLTGISFGALFYTLIGKKDEKITEEEAEVLQVKLKYEEAADTVRELESELADIRKKLAEVQYIDSELAAAMKDKKDQINAGHPEAAANLQSLTDQMEDEQANLKELQEAASAGRAVLRNLDQAKDRLNSAANWGTFDMLGGGMISTAVKHNHIDEARSAIHAAQRSLRRFQTELQDVQRDVNIHIEIGGLLTFADYFFDGLITDWMVQGRIRNSLDQVIGKRSQIAHIVSELDKECRKTQGKLAELNRNYTALIENI